MEKPKETSNTNEVTTPLIETAHDHMMDHAMDHSMEQHTMEHHQMDYEMHEMEHSMDPMHHSMEHKMDPMHHSMEHKMDSEGTYICKIESNFIDKIGSSIYLHNRNRDCNFVNIKKMK